MKELFIIAIICLTILILVCTIVEAIKDVKKFEIYAELESEGLLIENIEDEENENDE